MGAGPPRTLKRSRRRRVLVRTLVAAAAVALSLSAGPATAAAGRLPDRGVFVPGKSLAGVRLGMTKADVTGAWGKRHGVCRGCRRTTWYFNYRPFTPQGAGVVFARGRVVRVFTVWRPQGWRTPRGLAPGDDAERVNDLYGALEERECGDYSAIVKPGRGSQTVFYVFREKLWGFGLTRPRARPCV